MPKRPADRSYDVGNKRQRTEPAADGALDTITSSRQLQKCLAFHQDAAPEIRKGSCHALRSHVPQLND